MRRVERLRGELGMPRFVRFRNALLVDLENVLSVDALVGLLKGVEPQPFTEVFPSFEEQPVRGPEGRFEHELLIPFVRKPAAAREAPRPRPIVEPAAVQRTFLPGSDWLYACLFTGTGTADALLRERVASLVAQAREAGAVDGWFFIRYPEPEWHIRLRLHGSPTRLNAEVLPALHAAMAKAIHDGEVWRLQLDTYEREVERYGGPEGILLAERLFEADSDAVLQLLQLLAAEEGGEDMRWLLAVRGIDQLLGDLGLEFPAKCALMKLLSGRFTAEFRGDDTLRHWLGNRFRQERAVLEGLVGSGQATFPWMAQVDALFRSRSERSRSAINELHALSRAEKLSAPWEELAASFVHMHANRLLRSAHRAQELVLYEALHRTYTSQLARQRPARPHG